MKYRQTKIDLERHWNEHINFITTSAKLFDEGYEYEAKRIATSLRVLFHQTTSSHSLLTQLGLKNNFLLLSTSDIYNPTNLISSWTLLVMEMSNTGFRYIPKTSDIPHPTFFMKFDDWWNEIIFDDKKNVYTRADIIKFVANEDGGAHVDPNLSSKYANLTKNNSLGWIDNNGNTGNNPAYVAIRQIAHEVIISNSIFYKKNYTRKKLKNSHFEMIFLDNFRRFKNSKTFMTGNDISIDSTKIEQRTVYTHEYKDGMKFPVIL